MVKKYLVLALVILMSTGCFARIDSFYIQVKDSETNDGLADANIRFQVGRRLLHPDRPRGMEWATVFEMVTKSGRETGRTYFPIVGNDSVIGVLYGGAPRQRGEIRAQAQSLRSDRMEITRSGYTTIHVNLPLSDGVFDEWFTTSSGWPAKNIAVILMTRDIPVHERTTTPYTATTTTTLRRMEVPRETTTTTTRGFRKFRRF